MHSWERWHISCFNRKACAKSFFSTEKFVRIDCPCASWKPKVWNKEAFKGFKSLLAQEGRRELDALKSNRSPGSGPCQSPLRRPPPRCLREHPDCSLPQPFLHGRYTTLTIFLPVVLIRAAAKITEFSLWATHVISIMILLNPPQSSLWYYQPCFTEKQIETQVLTISK